jgi:hypothetical protein
MPNGEIHVMRTTWDVKRQEWFDSKDIVQNAPGFHPAVEHDLFLLPRHAAGAGRQGI